MHAPLYFWKLVIQSNLPWILIGIRPSFHRVVINFVSSLSNIKVDWLSAHFISPPGEQRIVSSGFKSAIPINLRSDVINVSILNPRTRIGIQIIIVCLSGSRLRAGWIISDVSPYSERTDAKLHV